MRAELQGLLACPVCHGELGWRVDERNGDHIEAGEARCPSCGAAYPVREGIGLFLTSDLPRRDLWEQVDSELAIYFREHPEVEQRLLQAPLETLGPADLFFRALVLEEHGRLAEARAAAKRAQIGLYTPEYRACYGSQLYHVVRHLSSSADKDEPIIDLASGQGELVKRLARGFRSPSWPRTSAPACCDVTAASSSSSVWRLRLTCWPSMPVRPRSKMERLRRRPQILGWPTSSILGTYSRS